MDRRAWLCLALLVCAGGCAGVAVEDPTPAGDAEVPPALSEAAIQRAHTVTVVDVVDGDTMEVSYRNGSRDTIRLLGVDTPEPNVETAPEEFEGVPDSPTGREWLRGWAENASAFARAEIGGEEVRIFVDGQADVRGSYGRLLVYVYHDGRLLNRALLEGGYARMYDTSFSQRESFSEVESRAQADGVGVWGYPGGSTATPDGEAALAVAEINADAPGDDNENRNGEYVVLANVGGESLDLSGWVLSDEAGKRYVFPEGFALGAGDRVTVYTGEGTDTDAELYWGHDGAVWNNDGDTVIVRTGDGERVVAESY